MAKKRGHNEGSIYQRKDGTWRAQVTINGKRVSHNAKTKKECREWIRQTLNSIDSGLIFKGAQETFEEFLSGWLISKKSALRPGTWERYSQIVRDYIAPPLGAIRLKDLRPDHIQKLYDTKLKIGVGARTVQLMHAVIHCSLGHAVKLGLIGKNPASVTMPPTYQPEEMKIYDDSQVNRMLVTAIGDRYEALYHLAVSTGMRQSELLGLYWSDVDWSRKTITVNRQLLRKSGGGFQFAPPKTKAGKRKIALGSKSTQKLREHLDRQHQERLTAGTQWQNNDLVFTSAAGTPIHQRNLHRYFKQLIKRAGLPEIRFHDLRHTAASLMLNHGIPLILVSRRLGHSKPSITLDIYGHLIPGMQADAAEKIDDLISPVEVGLHLNCTLNENLLEE